MNRLVKLLPVFALVFASAAHAETVPDAAQVSARKAAFVTRLVDQHGFDKATVQKALASIQINPKILAAISKPAERVVPWQDYRKIFLTEKRIALGADFWAEHAAELAHVSQKYGVAPEVIVAILGVETYYGQRMGSYRVLDALGTLAFAYPPRSKFFTSELEAFFVMSRTEGPGLFDETGSYAGAMGAGQFMPSSFLHYAVDGDGDGRRDLWHDWNDILASVANYLRENGWQRGGAVANRADWPAAQGKLPAAASRFALDGTVGKLHAEGYRFQAAEPAQARAGILGFEGENGASERWVVYHNFGVILRYNTSPKYALAAHELGEAILARHQSSAAR